MTKVNNKVFLGYLILIIVAVITSVIGIFIASRLESPMPQPSKPEVKCPACMDVDNMFVGGMSDHLRKYHCACKGKL